MTASPPDRTDDVRVLSGALDQAGDVLDHLDPSQLSLATPCEDWDVASLVDHLVAAPTTFLAMMRGEQPDWSATPAHLSEGWAQAFREAGAELTRSWRDGEDATSMGPGWQCAELAVHTWDLATAIGFPVERLDPEVAVRGLAFMQDNLTADNRGPAFGPVQAVPEGAGPYARIAAFAGRSVT